MTKQEIAKMIDHTLLAATATRAQIQKLCAEAKQYGFASVCVNPVWVKAAAAASRMMMFLTCIIGCFILSSFHEIHSKKEQIFSAKLAISVSFSAAMSKK